MNTPVKGSQERWPLWLAALLLAAGAVMCVNKLGVDPLSLKIFLPLTLLTLSSIAMVIAAAKLPAGPRLAWLCSAMIFTMRLGALAVVLPEFVASRLPVRWEVVLGIAPPKSECPIYYRMPDTLFDENRFLKRIGPDQWTGRPLNSILRMKNSRDVAYQDEATFTVSYDADGFRNPVSMKDWDLLVAGDSFVELGSLPDGETITDRLSTETGLRVKNLGVASTAPMNQASYARHFGHAASCRHAVLIWSETALAKTSDEWTRMKSGRSPVSLPTDNSLLSAVWGYLRTKLLPYEGRRVWANASFLDEHDQPVPVMLDPPYPKSPEELSHSEIEAMRAAFKHWSETAREMKMMPWLVFLPSKIRVWQGRLSGPKDLIEWEQNRLPKYVENLCVEFGIQFVDTTSALREASQQGLLVYNPVVDGHSTEVGAEIIAQVTAKAVRASGLTRGH